MTVIRCCIRNIQPIVRTLHTRQANSVLATALRYQPKHCFLTRCFSNQAQTSINQPSATPTTSSTTVSETPIDPITASALEEEKKPKIPLKRRIRTFLSTNRQFVVNSVVILSAASASYLVFDQCVELVSFMQSINHAEGLTYAFYGGAFVTISTYAIFRAALSLLPVKAAPAYRAVLKRLRQESSVISVLGAPKTYRRIQPSAGGFQCVTRRSGGPRFFKESSTIDYFGSWERWWRPRRVQFIMSVRGEKADAVLVCQADHKLNDSIFVKSMSLEHIQSYSPNGSECLPPLTVIATAPWRET